MTLEDKIVLSRWQRKERLGQGGVKRIAALAGVHQSLVSRVLHGKQRHARIEDLIAGAIGQPGEQVFPPRAA